MSLLIWAFSLCLACSNVCGMFFELPENTAATADEGSKDDFIGDTLSGIHQFFGVHESATTPKPLSQRKGHNSPGTTTSTGLFHDMETSLEHATNTLDNLWQQFRKGLVSLMGELSADTDQPKVTTTNSLLQLQTTTSALLSKATSTTLMPTTTATTTITTVTTTTLLTETTTMQPPLK